MNKSIATLNLYGTARYTRLSLSIFFPSAVGHNQLSVVLMDQTQYILNMSTVAGFVIFYFYKLLTKTFTTFF